MEARDLILSPSLSDSEIEVFFSSMGFKEPTAADRNIQHLVELTRAPERTAEFLGQLIETCSSSVDPDAALTQFGTYLETVPSPLNLISLLQEDLQTTDILIGILGASPFLSQILIRNPEYLYWLTERNRIDRVMDPEYFNQEANRSIEPFETLTDSMNALRRFKRRECLRIGAQDLLGNSRMSDTVSQVTFLADSILRTAFLLLSRERLDHPHGFLVVALGKLGGCELNFSSDIDLLFLYADDQPQREMHRFAREYSKLLGEYSPEGHLYRVDLRLRPMGRGGEIAYSEKAISNYYQTWADTTDRLALIKCRPVAGDKDFGRRFLKKAHELVFKKFHDHAAVEEIHWIKKRTDQEIRKKTDSPQNIKLGLGGIREIEFFVQAFQILYGGIQPGIRDQNSLTGLKKLLDYGYLTFPDYESLSEAYVFLRNLEHKLQLVHDLQTHSLPEEQRELIRCARRMGYHSEGNDESILTRFLEDLDEHNRRVRNIFESLFDDKVEERGLGQLALNPNLSDEEALEILSDFKVPKAEQILEGIRLLQQAPAFPHSPGRMRNLLANLIPVLTEECSRFSSPRDLLIRLDRFAENLGSRSTLYSELIENRPFAKNLFSLFDSGELLSEILIRHPEYLEISAHPSLGPEPLNESSRLLSSAADKSEFKEAIRLFKQREIFKTGVAELGSPGNLLHRTHLSSVADAILSATMEFLIEGTALAPADYCLIALGKLGGRELTFHSDLDLLFVLDDLRCTQKSADFEPIIRKFKEILTDYTSRGRAYEIDFRLRPEGRHASEVVTYSQLQNYFKSRVEAWERLAYTKSRIVYSSRSFQKSDLLDQLVYTVPFDQTDITTICHIRRRKEIEIGQEQKLEQYDFKVGCGALLDIQFLVQYLQIQHQIIEPNTLDSLNKLCLAERIDTSTFELLKEALQFYYSIEAMKDLTGQNDHKLSKTSRDNDHLARLLGYDSGKSLLDEYTMTARKVRAVYDSILNGN